MNESMLYWGWGLYGVAVLLVVIEIFVPSGGVLGLLAAVVAVAGNVCLWMYDSVWGAIGTATILVMGPVCVWGAFKMLPATPIGRRLLNSDAPPDELLDAPPPRNPLEDLLGCEGVALTDLRPVGAAKINGERHEVLADTTMIEIGTKVRVVGVKGTEIKVRAVRKA